MKKCLWNAANKTRREAVKSEEICKINTKKRLLRETADGRAYISDKDEVPHQPAAALAYDLKMVTTKSSGCSRQRWEHGVHDTLMELKMTMHHTPTNALARKPISNAT